MKLFNNNFGFTRALFSCLFVFCFILSYATESISSINEKSSIEMDDSCPGVTIEGGEGKITISGHGTGNVQVMITDSNAQTAHQCSYSCGNNYYEIPLAV